MDYSLALNFAVALGIGLMIGVERERKKAVGSHTPGGVRTFPIIALYGAAADFLGGATLLAVVTAATLVFAAIAYWRSAAADPGVTSETAMILTALLGGLSIRAPMSAAALGVIVTVLLAARSPLHFFVRRSLTNFEMRDGLIFAVASLVILPLLPERQMGPFDALNPHAIWVVVILIMAVSAMGHIATRLVGVRFGLPFSGFITGFISSSVAIGAMGSRVRAFAGLLGPAVAGAVLSTVATVVYLAAVIAITDIGVLKAMIWPLALASATAGVYGAAFTLRVGPDESLQSDMRSRAFSVPLALGLATILSGILLLTSAAHVWLDGTGTLIAAGLGGFVDTHAAAISVASLAASGKITAQESVVPIITAMTTNTISKLAFAATAGGWKFALRVIPGLIMVIAAAWLGALI